MQVIISDTIKQQLALALSTGSIHEAGGSVDSVNPSEDFKNAVIGKTLEVELIEAKMTAKEGGQTRGIPNGKDKFRAICTLFVPSINMTEKVRLHLQDVAALSSGKGQITFSKYQPEGSDKVYVVCQAVQRTTIAKAVEWAEALDAVTAVNP